MISVQQLTPYKCGHIFIYSTKMMNILTKKTIKTCNSTTKVQTMYKKVFNMKTEMHINQMHEQKSQRRTNTKAQHAYNKDYQVTFTI